MCVPVACLHSPCLQHRYATPCEHMVFGAFNFLLYSTSTGCLSKLLNSVTHQCWWCPPSVLEFRFLSPFTSPTVIDPIVSLNNLCFYFFPRTCMYLRTRARHLSERTLGNACTWSAVTHIFGTTIVKWSNVGHVTITNWYQRELSASYTSTLSSRRRLIHGQKGIRWYTPLSRYVCSGGQSVSY
jgi:hypothetical protein